jgi:PAS domain S-box-containing protein
MQGMTRKRKPLVKPDSHTKLSFQDQFDTIRDGVLILNAETGEVRYGNPAFSTLLGYSPHELIGTKVWELSAFRDIEEGKAAFLSRQNGNVEPHRLLLIAKSGRPVEFEYNWSDFRVGKTHLRQFNLRNIHVSSPTEKTLGKLRKEIDLLYESGQLLNRNLDLESLYDNFSHLIAQMIDYAMIFVSTYNAETKLIHCGYAIADGNRVDVEGFPPIPLEEEGHGTQSRVIRSGKPWLIRDYQRQIESSRNAHYVNLKEGTVIEQEEVPDDEVVRTAMIVPIILKDQVVGVVQIFSYKRDAFSEEDLSIVSTFASQFAVASNNALLYRSAQMEIEERIRAERAIFQAYDATIEGLSRAMDLRDKETEGHLQRVTEMTVKLARLFDFDENEMLHVRWGALMHDIGKIGVPDSILLKPGPLTESEWVVMRKHAAYAYELLEPIGYLGSALDIPYCHHEKWDGSGYPRGLKREEIPLIARIFAVVDVWDALCSQRPYRDAWTEEMVQDYLRSQSGTHFDPQVLTVIFESGLLVRRQPQLAEQIP